MNDSDLTGMMVDSAAVTSSASEVESRLAEIHKRVASPFCRCSTCWPGKDEWYRALKRDLDSGSLVIPPDPLLGVERPRPDSSDAAGYAIGIDLASPGGDTAAYVLRNGNRVIAIGRDLKVNVAKREVQRTVKEKLAAALRRTIKGIRKAILGFDPATILSQLEGIYAMQKQTADALNRLGAEVNSFTTDIGAFVAHSNAVIAEKTSTITDLTAKLEAAIANGTGTQEVIADLKEATSDIDAQTDRLAEVHKSLTDFVVPPVTADTPAPPIVTAPTVDPAADTIPPQPPVADGTAEPQAQAQAQDNTGTTGTGSTPAPGEPQQ